MLFIIYFVTLHSVFPCILHYSIKFIVSFNAGADITVVLTELIKSNDAILLLSIPKWHELHEEISFGFETRLDFWVLRSIIKLSNIIKFNLTISIDIKAVVSFSYTFYSSLVEITLQASNEFIEIDWAIFVSVKVG